MIGKTLGQYKIIEKLGEGSLATVYRAIDTRLGRSIAIKVLASKSKLRESNLKRFEREAQLASRIEHPNVCAVYSFEEIDGISFISMQYIDGQNLKQLVQRGPFKLRRALSSVIQVTNALAAAHALGIIHRDIKSGNIMVTNSGTVKVCDFGLAKLSDRAHERSLSLLDLGVPYGSAPYASPEQATGSWVDERTDIFSTGVVLYELLTGRHPFQGNTPVEMRYAILHDEPPLLATAAASIIPMRLEEIVDHALAKDPHHRYQRVEAFRDDLKEVLSEVESSVLFDSYEDLAQVEEPMLSATTGSMRRALNFLRKVTAKRRQT